MTLLQLTYLVVFLISGSALHVQAADSGIEQIALIGPIGKGHRPARYGLEKLEQALAAKNMQVTRDPEGSDFCILAGLSADDSLATECLEHLNVELPEAKEALLVKKTNYQDKPTVVLCGADDVGLMYAALDVAKRISWSDEQHDPFDCVTDIAEAPDVQERAISTGTFQRRYFEQRLHDSRYWEAYFDMMAENRLNQFLLIFGYKNNQYREPNFTAPVYPNFFDVDAYPNVKLSGISTEQQVKNSAALRKVIALAHERGIEFGVGLWDQIERDRRFSSMVRDDAPPPADLPDNIVWGLSKKNLIPYSKLAIRKFFQTFPDIDFVQFRMHWEAGITGDVALKFWKEIFAILKEECPSIKIEARAKAVPDETLYDGADTGMDFRVATKHWMEQMGMPFHPTHINKPNQHDRRHGYADLLRYPKRYEFKWRVWNGGTTRVLLWGDPDWVRLFAEGSHLYDAVGYELNEPLYFKMNGSPHDAPVSPLLNPQCQYYTYEFERYWHFYQLVGRLGYNPNTPAELWEREFSQRFGHETGLHLMRALHQASKILPRIVSASYLYSRFSSPQGWPELQRLEDLRHFALNSKPSDIQQFASPAEEADLIFSGKHSPKRLPSQTSDWFRQTAGTVLAHVEQAERSLGERPSREAISTITDLRMLAYLAMYHSCRLQAAVQYNLYDKTGDIASWDRAIKWESEAVAAYGRLVDAAGDVYNSRLDFGSNRQLFPGHWKQEYERLLAEWNQLRAKRRDIVRKSVLAHVPVRRSRPGDSIVITATLQPPHQIERVRVMFSVDGNDFQARDMTLREDGVFATRLPGLAEEGCVDYYLEITQRTGTVFHVPDEGAGASYRIDVSGDWEPPAAELERITTARLSAPLKVSARVSDPSGVERVNLRYRRVNQFEDYQSVAMTHHPKSGRYEAVIPAEFFDGKYDVMYFIEVIDTHGNGRMIPDMESEIPYVVVHLQR